MKSRLLLLLLTGILLLTVSLYQNFVLDRADFYTIFSLGMFLLLLAAYHALPNARLFRNWRSADILRFFIVLTVFSVLIDLAGMSLGYWIYPHYGVRDLARKYLFEWSVALLYHMLCLLIGRRIFLYLGFNDKISFLLSLLVFVTLIGFITESLNLQVYSWKIVKMPFSNRKIGEYFLVFQTVGYWLMALIPYYIYRITERSRRGRVLTQRPEAGS
jgi:hypothetical protein